MQPPYIEALHLVRRFKRETPARGFLGALTDLVRVGSEEREVVREVGVVCVCVCACVRVGGGGAGLVVVGRVDQSGGGAG